jgi:hypothetical protein
MAVAISFVACKEKKEPVKITAPSKVVAEALDAAKEGDFGTMVKVLDPDNDELGELKNMLGPDGANLTRKQKDVFDKFALMLRDFDYEITEEKVDGDTAEVEVAITTYDYQGMLRKLLAKMSGKALGLAMSYDSKEELVEDLKVDFIKKLGPALDKTKEEGKDKTTTVKVNLTRDGDEWKIDELNDETINALTGGLMYEVAGLAEMLDLE